MGTTVQLGSWIAVQRSRSWKNARGPACQSTPSYSATRRYCGHAKSNRHSRPLRSTISYCNTGGGNPPSSMTSRASLSIGDSAKGVARVSSSRTLTMPRRPDCRCAICLSSSTLQVLVRTAASSVASARGRRSERATSIAVHAGVVTGRPASNFRGAPSRRCTIRPAVDRNCRPTGLSTCTSAVRSVSKPCAAAAVPMQAATVVPVTKSNPRNRCASVGLSRQ